MVNAGASPTGDRDDRLEEHSFEGGSARPGGVGAAVGDFAPVTRICAQDLLCTTCSWKITTTRWSLSATLTSAASATSRPCSEKSAVDVRPIPAGTDTEAWAGYVTWL